LTNTEVEGLDGEPGHFVARLKGHPRYIDPEKCTGCGQCAQACPVVAVNEFNCGLDSRTATCIRYAQAVPMAYTIDRSSCIGCGICETVCLAKAIQYDDRPRSINLDVGAVILATGNEVFDPSRLDTYHYATLPNVITSLEFERILSASGPYRGSLMRPYDRDQPSRIAWLQCVGSRDLNENGHAYCSSVCCMYAIKQAVIAREHARAPLDTAIFCMDIRTPGKDFERYYERAREHGVRFIRSRVHSVSPVGDGNVEISYVEETGEQKIEVFNMVVLSVGLQTSRETVELAARLGVELNADLFVKTSAFMPVATSRAGVYVSGAVQGPKDIPQSVMEASAAAAAAGILLNEARWTQTRKRKLPEQTAVVGAPPRVGVFVCRCGINIAGVVNVPEVRDYAETLPHVVYVEDNLYTCSQDTQVKLAQVIREKGINRVVVAACTPRTHEPMFQETLLNAGLNKYLFEMANIRNQDSWVHSNEPQRATEKAKDLVRMAVAKASLLEPLEEKEASVLPVGLVIGGGLAGMQAALAIAASGYSVHLVEETEGLGGAANYIFWTWNGKDVQPFLRKITEKVMGHPLITVHMNSSVVYSDGFVGNFRSTIRRKGVERKAITLDHGIIVLATGAHACHPDEYLYGAHPNVLLWHELDQRIAYRDSLVTQGLCGVFIQCVGSREPAHPYCSRICCTHSLHSALKINEINPKMDIYILYRDVRTFGLMEDLYRRARAAGIRFIRYVPDNKPDVRITEGGELELEVLDHILMRPILIHPDFINLATAIESTGNEELSRILKVPLNADGFYMEAHAKLRPVDFSTDGIFVCGLAHYPKSIEESLTQALAAAARAVGVMAKGTWTTSGLTTSIDAETCKGCKGCMDLCAYGAIGFNEDRHVCEVNQALCKGCGACAASCPSGSARLSGFTRKQLNAQLAAAFSSI